MAKDEPTKPIDAPEADPPVDAVDAADDTEGHSIGLLLGMNAMSQANDSAARARARKIPEPELPQLTKKWPSMRDEKKG